jgi:hypothetical protein
MLRLRGSTALRVRGSRKMAHAAPPWKTVRREADANIDIRKPRRTRGVRIDFKYLSDPFPDE